MPDPNLERITKARDIAQQIIIVCDHYQRVPSQVTLNHFLSNVERLADLAEDIEVAQTLKALDG
jgi:hypothetical protein